MGRTVDVKSGDLLICFAITFGGRVKCRLTLQCIVFCDVSCIFCRQWMLIPAFFTYKNFFLCLLRAGADEQMEESMEKLQEDSNEK